MARSLATLGRHQFASLVCTVIDFGTMTLAVELLKLRPEIGTALGATAGAITNFQLGRHFTFKAKEEKAGPQAVRYAMVSLASAGWNVLGEHVFVERLHVQYFLARVIVSIAVSLFWNFPLQRWFVFRKSAARHSS